MALISCDMRYGRTDEQKRQLAAGLLRVVSEATGETKNDIFIVFREVMRHGALVHALTVPLVLTSDIS
jgi:phenylpyruvate tautomerase PptA (4-oxalocrotonate tautomerase family)